MFIGWYEWNELHLNDGARVIDKTSGKVIPSQKQFVPSGVEYVINLKLDPKEEKEIYLEKHIEQPIEFVNSFEQRGTDRARIDIGPKDINSIETDAFKITYKAGIGIDSIYSKQYKKELLHGDFSAFAPVYELTPVKDAQDIGSVRGAMGRNRKGFNVQRTVGKLQSVQQLSSGKLWKDIELNYTCDGMEFYKVILRVWKELSKIDIQVILHKQSVWAPENLYIALPFTTNLKESLWIDKPDCIFRPMHDQIPGTLTDFYTVQTGFIVQSKNYGISLSMPDTPILQLGPLQYGNRKLAGNDTKPEKGYQFAWVMSNYWETNFNASLGGFYEFSYTLEVNDLGKQEAFAKMKNDSLESVTLRLK